MTEQVQVIEIGFADLIRGSDSREIKRGVPLEQIWAEVGTCH